MSKVLVVFFSRTGGTQLLAHRIAHAGEWECEAIHDPTPRGGVLGYLRCGYEATFQRVAPIDPIASRLEDYDLVAIGTPTWNYSLSSPVRAFLEQHRDRLRRVAFFVTCGGNPGRTIAQMTALVARAPLATVVATMVATRRDLKAGPFASIEHFVFTIEHALAAAAPPPEASQSSSSPTPPVVLHPRACGS